MLERRLAGLKMLCNIRLLPEELPPVKAMEELSRRGIPYAITIIDHIFSLYNLCHNRKIMKLDTFVTFIDYQKVFDFVNHAYLYSKPINTGITGKNYFAIKSIYTNPLSCVQLNGTLLDWFRVISGVRQGDSLSPVLFSILIDDLAHELRDTKSGVDMGGEQISLFMYADDIALVSDELKVHNNNWTQ